jgi:hypothetical protein
VIADERHLDSTQPIELLDGEITNRSSPAIQVAADVLATDIWQDLVDTTQSDLIERGLAIARHSKTGKLTRSTIFRWYYEFSEESDPEVIENTCQIPLFPFGVVRSLLSPRLKEDVYIHTHPISPALDHLRTNPISDADLHAFVPSRFQALVILDRGGAHLLARTSSQKFLTNNLPAPDLINEVTREAIAESGGSMDVMTKVARRIAQHGLGYYYTPDLSQQSDTVEFKNLRTAETLAVLP